MRSITNTKNRKVQVGMDDGCLIIVEKEPLGGGRHRRTWTHDGVSLTPEETAKVIAYLREVTNAPNL